MARQLDQTIADAAARNHSLAETLEPLVDLELESRNSRTEHPDIGISDGEGNGKYWSRHLVSTGPTDLQPGDQFEERTAYVVFRCSKAAPLREFLAAERKIWAKFRR